MNTFAYVVWDFDGVINNGIQNGRFVWADNIERDLGFPRQSFEAAIFNDEFEDVIRGKKDLLAHVNDWLSSVDCKTSAEEILDYWFRKDARVDPQILALIDEFTNAGGRNVIATNNEHRRASYIENQLGMADKVERVFASGRLKCAKPEDVFFELVAHELHAKPQRLLLVDDHRANIDKACELGWATHHFQYEDYSALKRKLRLDSRFL